nr:copper chaperone PCu(A)C [Rhodovibrio salinarum]
MLVLLAGAFAPLAAFAHSAEVEGIKIGHAWAPPTSGENAAVYMPIVNDRSDAVTLVSATTPVAESVVLRKGTGDDAQVYDALKLSPGQPVSLAEWAVHLWLQGIDRELQAGDRFPLTLTFEPGGAVELEIIVEDSPGH